MPYVTLEDVDLFYEEEGAGDPVVLVHGSWSDHTDWDGLAPLLVDRLLVVRHDRRGYGRTRGGIGAVVARLRAAEVRCPARVTRGTESPRWLREVATLVAARVRGARAHRLIGCGHLPHQTHPARYAAVIEGFIDAARPGIGNAPQPTRSTR